MFNLLKFRPHPMAHLHSRLEGLCADYKFDNGWEISVLFGKNFYSNGVDTYEVAVLDEDGNFAHPAELDNWFSGSGDIMRHLSEEEISEIMFELWHALPLGEL